MNHHHHHHHHQVSLAERQRQILEKGLKRRPQREDRYENDSASGEDPLMGGSSAPLARQQPQPHQQQRLSKQARVEGPGLSTSSVGPPAVPRVVPRTRTPVKASPQRSVAVVLASTPKKDREEFVVVKEDDMRVEPMKAVNGLTSDQTGRSAATAQPSTEEPEPVKRRGRPKGWKPGMAYTDLRPRPNRPTTTSNTAATGQKRRGRPPKPASPPPKQLYHQFEAGFFAFLCEWKGCQAELHNLATLRRHVHVVHGEEGSDQGCKWGPCATSTSASTTARQDTIGRKFRTHIEEQHLIPLSWHVGDGPRHLGDGIQAPTAKQVGAVEDGVPRWLKDDEGRQVTQGIWEQEIEDLKTWKERRRRLKELLIRRDENLQSEEEDDGGGETQEGK